MVPGLGDPVPPKGAGRACEPNARGSRTRPDLVVVVVAVVVVVVVVCALLWCCVINIHGTSHWFVKPA